MALHTLFSPALAQIEAKWATMDEATRARLTSNLPSLEERHAFLDWNARLSMQDKRLLDPCQAAYGALMTWDTLSPQEQVAVFMAAIEPLTKLAAAMGLVQGVPAGRRF